MRDAGHGFTLSAQGVRHGVVRRAWGGSPGRRSRTLHAAQRG
ncbi:Hypothetical protein CAP_7310 [Chondromyces apiculatus DSM 436]|uniref:Uncharacterized protein n=1 Tax=Chondromyces apiculatus DSM 436 TaxID=1192034 RepID=A0A017SZ42_9BACT|nr:Hypothetical protein CAP_7310 [Chondromyces apiculatus DSM 436]